MKVKIKRCLSCETLLRNSSKICNKCGSEELESGFYSDEPKTSILTNELLNKPNNQIMCPTCSAWVTINEMGFGECCFCGDEIHVSYGMVRSCHEDFIEYQELKRVSRVK